MKRTWEEADRRAAEAKKVEDAVKWADKLLKEQQQKGDKR